MSKDISATLEYARKKLKEFKRLLSMDAILRYSSTEEVESLMNSSESLIEELEAYGGGPRGKLPKEIIHKMNKLKDNLEKLSSELAKSSLSILSPEDFYYE
jgi:hypothetical protein